MSLFKRSRSLFFWILWSIFSLLVVLLLKNVTAFYEPRSAAQFESALRKYVEAGATEVPVTHVLDSARSYDRICLFVADIPTDFNAGIKRILPNTAIDLDSKYRGLVLLATPDENIATAIPFHTAGFAARWEGSLTDFILRFGHTDGTMTKHGCRSVEQAAFKLHTQGNARTILLSPKSQSEESQ